MEENRSKLLVAARRAFASSGYVAASMDDLSAEVGLTRGALYSAFGDKLGLLAAVVAQIDGEMAERARQAGGDGATLWERMIAEWTAHIEMALDPEIQRIVLRDGHAFLGDPSGWPSASACLEALRETLVRLMEEGTLKALEPRATSRLLSGAAFNAASWVAASDDPAASLPAAIQAFQTMAEGLLLDGDRGVD